MKKITILFAALAMFFVVSCGGDEEDSNKAGAACESEGAKSCSADGSEVLVCSGSSWQTLKQCYGYLGQYCRKTADGDYNCTDSGSSSGSNDSGNSNGNSDNGSTNTNNGENGENGETNDDDNTSDSGDSTNDNGGESNDEDSSNNTSDDANSTDDSDSTNSENSGVDPDSDTPLETCEKIYDCKFECRKKYSNNQTDLTNCNKKCINRGETLAHDNYVALEKCFNNYVDETTGDINFNELVKDANCKTSLDSCGFIGNTDYAAPYGTATVETSINYIFSSADADSSGMLSITEDKSAPSFITGTFGTSNTQIIDTNTIKGSLAFAQLSEYSDTHEKFILITQTYKDTEIDCTPIAQMRIDVSEPGTYTVGVTNDDKVKIFIREYDENCTHAFGFGSITISSISFTPGTTTLAINKGEITLYSLKNAPMFLSGDISDDTNTQTTLWKGCAPK